MGRRTYDSIGRPLPDRISIVLTRDAGFHPDGVLVARSPEDALRLAGNVPEVIVFGGAEVFRQFLPMADRIYLTEVDADVGGDTSFDFDQSEWRVAEDIAHPADQRHAHPFKFLTLERIRKG